MLVTVLNGISYIIFNGVCMKIAVMLSDFEKALMTLWA